MAFAASAIESCRSPARRVTNVKANATPFTTSRRRTTVRRGDPRVPVRRRRLHSGPGFPPVFEISFRRTADMMIGAGPSRRSDRTCNPVERVAAVTTNGSRTGNSTNARSFCATRSDRKPPPTRPQISFIRPNGRTTYIPGFLHDCNRGNGCEAKGPCPPSTRSQDFTFRDLQK